MDESARIFLFESSIEAGPPPRVPDEGRNEQGPWTAVVLLVSSRSASNHNIKAKGYISGEIPRNTQQDLQVKCVFSMLAYR